MSLRVARGGLFTTVQDLGRRGRQHEGVPVGGAMDDVASRLANWLVGNDADAAVLEATLVGPALEADEDTMLAITGADMDARIGERRVRPWHTVLLREGETIVLAGARRGCRAYVAAAGGIDVAPVLGSRSTYVRARLGGMEGRTLERGDVLPVSWTGDREIETGQARGDASRPGMHRGIDTRRLDLDRKAIRFIAGTHHEMLTQGSRAALTESAWTLGSDSDRMGLRLAGEALALRNPVEPLSAGVTMGTIQLPPSGQPIVLMADRQTTGGYPRLGEVATVDLAVLAQLRPGEEVRFVEVTLHEAERLYLARERELDLLRRLLATAP